MVKKSVKTLDKREHFVYNKCIYVNAVTELSAGEDYREGAVGESSCPDGGG
ncbi:hypothetical protein [Ruminococcus albus]|uniref:Uncharacterized protein n=1 Tax=Ruminococcus albus TaxID=1264 RepID=A0A1H7FHY8_RUMAL|nr:hypothetical protein [Ruminococcus albus]SEK23730.1 hypothetical protein SAMN05216469_101210 [Ruminococcus albus]